MFIDETWVKTNMTRPRGRSPRGTRLPCAVPHGHWKTTTFLAGLRTQGLVAPLVVDGAINGELFRGYVEQHLAPTLASGDIVILDNLNSHKVAGVRAAIEAVGAELLYLPPYSPDLNPIEQVFAKFKWLIRSAQERTVAGLWKRCGQLLERFSESEYGSRQPAFGRSLSVTCFRDNDSWCRSLRRPTSLVSLAMISRPVLQCAQSHIRPSPRPRFRRGTERRNGRAASRQ